MKRWLTLRHRDRKRAQITVIIWQRLDIVLLNEPNNHLNLPAIECLENALMDCLCWLLLISHDWHSLSQVANRR